MFEKLQRSRENYAVNKSSLNQIKHFEKILSVFYKKYGCEIFDVFQIRVEQMNWSIITSTTVIDGENYRVLGGYAYILYSNKTIKIIKL
jgi:hypothetical protein